MKRVDSKALSARFRIRGLYLASTALVGFSLRPLDKPSVLHVPSSAAMVAARMARLLGLAIESSTSLLARLNPVQPARIRKVRPAARVGRRKWREAAAASLLLTAASTAHAQDATWSGATSAYGTPTNWTPNTVPVSGGTATFDGSGSQTVDLGGASYAPGSVSVTGGTYTFQNGSFANTTLSLQSGTITQFGAIGAARTETTITSTDSFAVTHSGTVKLINTGTISTPGPDVFNGNGNLTLLNSGTIFSSVLVAVNTNGNATVTNAAGGILQGGSNAVYGNGVNIFGTGTVNNYGSILGGATGSNATLQVGAGSAVNLFAGSTTTSVLLGANSNLSLYTGTGTGSAAVVDPLSTIVLQAAGTNAAATVGAIAFGTGGTLNLRGTGDGTAANGATGLFGGSLSGDVALTKLDSGTFVLTGANTYTGGTTISGGVLQLGSGGTTGAIAGNVVLANNAALTFNRSDAVTFAGAISGSGPINQIGAGTTTLTGANTYSGATMITGGTLRAGAANRFSANSAFTVGGGGVLDLGGFDETIGSLDGAGTVTNSGTAAATLSTGGLNASPTFSGVIQNGTNAAATTRLTKTGSGTLVLTGANTYTGTTTISGGRLQIGNGGTMGSIGTGAVIDNGALLLSRSDSITFANDVSGSGTIVVQGVGTGNTATLSGALTNLTGVSVQDASSVSLGNGAVGGVYEGGTGSRTLSVTGGTVTGGASVSNAAFSGLYLDSNAVTTVSVSSGATIQSTNTSAGNRDGITALGTTMLTNRGTIQSAFNAGVALAGGGSIDNFGTITGGSGSNGYGIAVSNAAAASVTLRGTSVVTGGLGAILLNSTGAANVTLDQGSTVTGQILSQNSGARTLAVNGALNGAYNGGSGTSAVNFTLGATGTMQGATFGSGNDTFTYQGGTVSGTINAGGGTDALVSALGTSGTGTLNQANLTNFESYAQQSGTLTLTGTNTSNVGWALQGGALNVAGTLSTAGLAVNASDGTTLRVASGGVITNTSGVTVSGSGAFTIVNAGTIRNNGNGSDVINTGATVTLLNSGTISNVVNVAAGANGAGSRITNARSGSLTGGSGTQYGIGANLGAGGTIDNYGTISGGATLAGGGGTLSGSTGITANLYAGSSTGTVKLGNDSTLSLYTGSGTGNTTGVTTTDPVTGQTVVLQNAGTNAAATVGGIALGTGSTLALRGTGDGTAANGASGALDMSTVSGATTLSKQDAGTFVLTGGYGSALATNVTGGRLVASNTGNAFGTSGTVAISSGATVELNSTGNNGYTQAPNTFTGTGTIEKTGTGAFTFGGNGGNTNISLSQGGLINVLQGVLGGSSSGQGIWTNNRASLNVAAGATFNTVEAAVFIDALTGAGTYAGGYAGTRTTTIGVAGGTGTFSGTLQDNAGTGGLAIVKTGAGTQTLSGANTYTGGTTISGGVLQLGNGGASGSITGDVTDNGRLAFNRNDAVTFAGTISGTGSVTQDGTGTTVLTANNSYSGGTTISAGTLQLGNGGGLGSITGDIANSGTLAFNRSDETTFAGVISGTGAVSQIGSGTTTLTGTHTYTGATAISAGTLQIGDGGGSGSLAEASAITDDGALILNRSGTLAFGNAVSGSGSLTVRGATNAGDGITLFGALTQTGGFTIADASTVTLSGSYSGGPEIRTSGGSFTILGSASTTGEGLIAQGGTLTVGSATNSTASLQGTNTAIQGQSATRLVVNNYGTIGGTNFEGITARGAGGATIHNYGTGTITAGGAMEASAWAIGNDGNNGGALAVTNDAGGRVVGRGRGILGTTATDSVTNAGTIASGTLSGGTITLGGSAAIELQKGGTVINQAGATIQSAGQGILSAGALSLTNAGTIDSTNESGVLLQAGGTISNTGTGIISGQNGIDANLNSAADITVTGNGTLTGRGGFGVRAVSAGGSVVLGTADAALGAVSGTSTAILASTSGTGTVGIVTAGAVTSTGGDGINATAGSGVVSISANGGVTASGSGISLTGNNAGNAVTVAAETSVQGAIGLRIAGTGTTTLVNNGTIAANEGGNALQIDGGTLNIGEAAGTLTGKIAIANDVELGTGTLTVNRTTGLTLANTFTGAGTLNQNGAARLELTGVNSAENGQFTGTANVNAGILAVNGVFGDTEGNSATVNVNTDGTLHGSGTIAGSVIVNNGGTVSAGNSPGTLTVNGDYTLNAGSTSLFELGAPGTPGGSSNDLINVGGALTLGGTLSLVSATDAMTAPVSGAYRLFNYNTLTADSAFETVTTPGTGTSALVYTDVPNQVNVLLTNGNQSVQYFDGTDMTGTSAGGQGGSGTWNTAGTNWTNSPTNTVNDIWRSGVGIFGGTAGLVTVEGVQNLQGLQFTVDGYQLAGTGTLNLTGDSFTTANQSFINVDGEVGVTIANALTSMEGTIGLRKLGDGTLTLTGTSTYTGDTTVDAGTLAIDEGGSITSSVVNLATFINAGTVGGSLTNSGTATNSGGITGAVANSGIFSNSGTVGGGLTNNAGTTTNTGTINGGAAILAGIFDTSGIVNGAVTNAGTINAQGQINGSVANGSGATFNVVGDLTGIGRFTNDGALDLGGNGLVVGSLSGTEIAATIANGGTLNAGSDGSSSGYAGTINGATALTKAGAGTLTLSGANSYTGATTISAGTLQAGAASGFSAASAVTIADGGRMDLNSFNQVVASLAGAGSVTLGSGTLTTGGNNASTSYAGAISGTGGLIKLGSGTFSLTAANSYTGDTTVSAGTLVIAQGGYIASSVTNMATFTNGGTVGGSLINAGTATNSGGIGGDVANSGTFTNGGTVSGGLTNSGTTTNNGGITGAVANSGIFSNSGTATGGLTNAGTFTNTGTLSGGLTNTGTVTASAGRIDGAIANNAGTFTVSGNLASNGTFANAGDATLAVTGSGAYGLAGLLTNAGSLTVASGGSLTAPAGIDNSGSIRVAQGGTITDALANSGSVVNDGAYNADVSNTASGTIVNSATGTWTGNLTANAGTIGNAGQWTGNLRNDAGGTLGNTGTITGAVTVAGGSFATSGTVNGSVTNAGTVTASGRINGAVSNGAGASFSLTGPLAGVTTVTNNGTLDLGGTAFTVGSLSGTATTATLRNGALTTNGDNSSTSYAGTIADGAVATSLIKAGTGSLTLTGTNTYTGGTTVQAGTLVASAANLGSGPVTSNADLVIDQASDATLGSAINGTGRFIKRGAAALTYTGTGTLSGATTVEAGRLSVNGSLANSVVTVANAATLGGSGTVGGIVANAGGTIAPGVSPGTVGTLRVAGNVLFASQSLYQLDATASGQSDRIAATGTATLQGGTVQVTAQAGAFTPTTSYTILSAAGGVTGRFAGVTSNFAYLTPFLTYDANDAILRLARNDLQFATTAQTRNQGNVAGAAQATGVGSRLYDAIAVLSAPQSRVAFNALSGEIHSSAITAQFENAFLVREAVLDRMRWGDAAGFGGGSQGIGQRFAPGSTLPGAYTADLPGRAPTLSAVPTRLIDPQPIAVWGQGFGSFGSTASDGNAARLARQTSGFVLGADARVENNWRLGAAGGYSFTNLDITGRLSSGTVESGYGALYASGPLGTQSPLQLRLGATYGGNSLTTRRAVTFAGFSENAGARYGGTTAQGFAEVGYRVGTGASYLEPFIGGAAIRIGRDGINETGGASALTSAGRSYDLATSTIGLRAEGRLSEVFASDLPIMVRALVGYRRAYGDVVPSALLAFAGGQQFVSAGIPIDRDALVAQVGIDWQMAPSTTLGVGYTGQVGQRAQDHGVKGNFTYRF